MLYFKEKFGGGGKGKHYSERKRLIKLWERKEIMEEAPGDSIQSPPRQPASGSRKDSPPLRQVCVCWSGMWAEPWLSVRSKAEARSPAGEERTSALAA